MYHRSLRQLLELQEKRRRDGATATPPASIPRAPAPPNTPTDTTVTGETQTETRPSGSGRPDTQNTKLPNEQPAAHAQRPGGATFTRRNHIAAPKTAPPPLTIAA
jgi:hypothetical protein